jgi:hypothetical protein
MTSSPRGLALLIDNEDFDTLPPRRGSHVDSACLTRLFQQLGFWVVLRRNLGRVSLEFELVSFATDTMHHSLDMAIGKRAPTTGCGYFCPPVMVFNFVIMLLKLVCTVPCSLVP